MKFNTVPRAGLTPKNRICSRKLQFWKKTAFWAYKNVKNYKKIGSFIDSQKIREATNWNQNCLQKCKGLQPNFTPLSKFTWWRLSGFSFIHLYICLWVWPNKKQHRPKIWYTRSPRPSSKWVFCFFFRKRDLEGR